MKAEELGSTSLDRRERRAARIITMLALYLAPVLLIFIALGQWVIQPSSGATRWINIGTLQLISADILRQHFAAVIGLPAAAILSLWVVTILRYQSGPIEFEAVSFKFRGASGPIILWVICFLAITVAIRVLW